MSSAKFHYVYCDDKNCARNEEGTGGEGSYAYGGNLRSYRQALAREGWTYVGRKDYCSECSKRRTLGKSSSEDGQ